MFANDNNSDDGGRVRAYIHIYYKSSCEVLKISKGLLLSVVA